MFNKLSFLWLLGLSIYVRELENGAVITSLFRLIYGLIIESDDTIKMFDVPLD